MRLFRLVSLIEGLSLLTLLLVAIPLRAYLGLHEAVYYVGWTHGVLFLVYGALALVVSHRRGWSIAYWLMVFLLGAVPFGFLVVDAQLKRALRSSEVLEGA
ncbi:MAG: DUF3817 domain-containing protein [Thiohalorhabdus sp.]|uniref:DUF3817 domain-containing protein n=1 Tax=Thiohalorhabdus sp. TaxID=3094134 RepID=UPI0039819168